MAEASITYLAQWLHDNGVTRNQLATELQVSPHAIDNLASGATTTLNKDILRLVAERTRLPYDRLIDGETQPMATPCATGDHRIDKSLADIARTLHTPKMFKEVAKWISDDFLCYGSNYRDEKPMTFSQMCDANLAKENIDNITVVHSLLSTTWYTPRGTKAHNSTILHTYWRALYLAKNTAPMYNDTFAVYEFEKSIADLGQVELPKITSWWWDQPSQYNRAPMESYPKQIHDAMKTI